MNIKNTAIITLLAILALLLPFTVYMTQGYFSANAKLESLSANQDILREIALQNHEAFAKHLDKLETTFLENRYILNNHQSDEMTLQVETICQQKNGINCVFKQGDHLQFIGNHEDL